MKELYKLMLAISATSWVIVFYGIKEEWAILSIPAWLFSIFLLLIPVILSAVNLFLTLLLGKDTFNSCVNLEEVNNSFLPTYLGYFFVGLGVDKIEHLIFVYCVILVFDYISQARYFNPLFLLFGYRFYNAETDKGTKIMLLVRKNLRVKTEAEFNNLRRINDTTFIAWRNKNEPSNG